MNPDNPTSQELQAYKIEVQNRLIQNASLGEDCDPQSFFINTLEAKRIGLTEDERFQNFLHTAGEDPILRKGLYVNLREDIKNHDDAQTPQEKELELQSIQKDLQLVALLGMDQESDNPNYKPFYEFIVQTKAQYGPKEFKTDQEKAEEFYAHLEQASRHIDEQQNTLNLQNIKTLEEYADVESPIQSLASDYSRKDFNLQSHHLLSIQEISEKLATELEQKRGWDKTAHDNNVAAIALALNLEITNQASQISEQGNEQLAPEVASEKKLTDIGEVSDYNEFRNKVPYVLLQGDDFVQLPPQEIDLTWAKFTVEQSEAVNNGISILTIPAKGEDAVGVIVSTDGTVSIAVADGVSNCLLPATASRMAVRGSLEHLSQNIPSLDTFRSAHTAINNLDLDTIANNRVREFDERADKERTVSWRAWAGRAKEELAQKIIAHTTLATAQYSLQESRLKVAVKGDSSVLIFRKDGQIERFYNPRNPQIYYDKSHTSYPEGGEIIEDVDIDPSDVVILCSDGLIEESFEKINQYLRQARLAGSTDRLDKQVKKLIMNEPKDFVDDDDVSVVIFSPPAVLKTPEPPAPPSPPPPPEAPPSSKPSSIPEARAQIEEEEKGTLIDKLNSRLSKSHFDHESFDTTPQDLIDYVKTIPLKLGASIKSINALQIGERLDLKGTINGFGVDSNFEALVENDETGGIKVTLKRLDLPFPASLQKGEVEKQITNLNNLISTQINKQIDPTWEVSGFRLTEKGIVFDFRKKQQNARLPVAEKPITPSISPPETPPLRSTYVAPETPASVAPRPPEIPPATEPSNSFREGNSTTQTEGAREPWQMTYQEYAASYPPITQFATLRKDDLEAYLLREDVPQEEKMKAIDEQGPTIVQLFNLNREAHREAIAKALSEGKTIPPEVLKDYPDLAQSTTLE